MTNIRYAWEVPRQIYVYKLPCIPNLPHPHPNHHHLEKVGQGQGGECRVMLEGAVQQCTTFCLFRYRDTDTVHTAHCAVQDLQVESL